MVRMPDLLEVEDLRIDLPARGGTTTAVDGLDLRLAAGEILGLVGESGCGKSVFAQSVTRLLPEARFVRGTLRVDGLDVAAADEDRVRRIRGSRVAHVFQEPGSSLTPWIPVGRQVREMLELHRPAEATDAEVVRRLREVGIGDPERRLTAFPHELSGGMLQRVLIAMAVAARPALLVADEPTTALDVTLQAQVLDLLRNLRKDHGTAVLLISHNLHAVSGIADRVAVLYAGSVVESGPAAAVLGNPAHPYTRGLIAAQPRLPPCAGPLAAIPGTVARIDPAAPGCRFGPRCPLADPECFRARPSPRESVPGHVVRCPRT